MNKIKKIFIFSFFIFLGTSFLFSENNSGTTQKIQIIKGVSNLTEAEKIGKQIFQINDVTVLINDKNVTQNSDNLTITFNNGEVLNVYSTYIETLDKKISLEDNQALTLEQNDDNKFLSITPAMSNTSAIKIQDTDSSGNIRTYLLNAGNNVNINDDKSVVVSKGEITIESQGQTLQIKEGDSINPDNNISSTNQGTNTQSLDGKQTNTKTKTKTEQTNENNVNTDNTKNTKEDTKPESENIKNQNNQQDYQNQDTATYDTFANITNEPTDFGNDLTDFSATIL